MQLNIRNGHVLFVVMPWAFPDQPVIGPSLLQQRLEESGFKSQVLYPGLELIQSTGPVFYASMANDMAYYELSEHLFSCYVHGEDRVRSDLFFEHLKSQQHDLEQVLAPDARDVFTRLRDVVVPGFIDRLASAIAAADVPAVGLSCTFNQVMASLALAKQIKALKPSVKTLFGGPSFDCEMGLAHHRKYHSIVDHVFLGEADAQIVEIIAGIRGGGPLESVAGLTAVENGEVKYKTLFSIAERLDDVPLPNYDDFFIQRSEAADKGCELPPLGRLPFESSRGCWWATKSTCSFCGLNGGRFAFRAKSPSRVVAELEELSTRHSTLDFRATDNIIDMSYFKGLFPLLATSGVDYSIWYQTRTSLKKDQIAALKSGKVTLVQAGIESFSDAVLKVMRKGVTGLQNIQFLKWCKESGIRVSYFVLYGFAGESGEVYDKVAGMVPLLVHLQPPVRMQPIDLHRFSPMHSEPAAFGIEETYMREDSIFVYPDDLLEESLMYSFRHYSAKTESAEQYITPLRTAIDDWIACYYQNHPVLEMRVGRDFLLVRDSRWGDEKRYYLNEVQKEVILLSDSVCGRRTIEKALRQEFPDADPGIFAEEIKALGETGMIFVENDRLLALPVREPARVD